jgi:hypothetical protein
VPISVNPSPNWKDDYDSAFLKCPEICFASAQALLMLRIRQTPPLCGHRVSRACDSSINSIKALSKARGTIAVFAELFNPQGDMADFF